LKVDLVMWAKDGSKTLSIVFKRIEEVIPSENVNQKIFVDDHSVDNSVKIATTNSSAWATTTFHTPTC